MRRRSGIRWAGGIVALVVVAGLVTLAVLKSLSSPSHEYLAGPSPSSTMTPGIEQPHSGLATATPRAAKLALGFSTATFPLAGGADFARASSDLKCGDAAPSPQSEAHGMRLEETTNEAWLLTPVRYPSEVSAILTSTTNADLGVVATSGVDYLVASDGIIIGMIDGGLADFGSELPIGGPETWWASIAEEWVHCPGEPLSESGDIEPGRYELIAVARVFSTPESVAISQAIDQTYNTWYLNPEHALERYAIYLPGSFDCEQLVSWTAVARGCLPEITKNATVDPAAGAVTMTYRSKGLADEFSVVFVSEPHTVTFESSEYFEQPDAASTFDALDDFTCGASGNEMTLSKDIPYWVLPTLDDNSVRPLSEGGSLRGVAWATGVPDGSRVELLPGARLIYVEVERLDSPPDGPQSTLSTVIASAPVTGGAITTDRFAGPQSLVFGAGPATLCPAATNPAGLDSVYAVIAGQWRISSTDGVDITIDVADYVSDNPTFWN